MEKLPPFSQLAKVALLLLLLLLTPFISSSLRPSYLYFILNILIVALGVEAGVLRAASGPRNEKKPTAAPTPINLGTSCSSPHNTRSDSTASTHISKIENFVSNCIKAGADKASTQTSSIVSMKPVAKEKVGKRVDGLKRCPSRPSLFFISSFEPEDGEAEKEEEEEEWKDLEAEKQELFAKAETFIGDFYKQLKMQREDSWKKLQDLYHRAF
uniref:DUF4408 domain-containing protein n=1 Tax=Ananas comosus var. bracteatus TaxID=296719 RepID=A0A6V7PVM7_ANACO|nr:unnamed protein product [Ananas comosus var. bracteatus]